jgi:hypothetical protein
MDTSAVKFVVVVGFMLRDVGKIPWNFPWNHRPKRGWFHSIYILGWKVPELWFHGNSMERSSRCPTLLLTRQLLCILAPPQNILY